MTTDPSAENQGRRKRFIGGKDLGKDNSEQARRVAAAILEVLAGSRTPAEAASVLGVSVPWYYQLEAQALHGLLAACEPRPHGRGSPRSETLARENERLHHELQRQQALLRAAQRALGLPPTDDEPPGAPKPRRKRLARGLSVAEHLRQSEGEPDAGATSPHS
jgi:hypothetical protein